MLQINESNAAVEENGYFLELPKTKEIMDIAVQVGDQDFLQSPKAKEGKDVETQVESRYFSQSPKTKQIKKEKNIATMFETKGQSSSVYIYEVISEPSEKKW